MIISHKHKFIFVKTRKTAGTSIEIGLSKICGDDDIITGISENDEIERIKFSGRTLQNDKISLAEYKLKTLFSSLSSLQLPRFYNHMPCQEIKTFVPKTVWDNYYKFSIERNPFDRMVSLFFWRKGDHNYSGIYDFLVNDMKKVPANFDLYSINDKVVVDKVYQYEHLDELCMDLTEKLNLKEAFSLPVYQAKSDTRKVNKYQDVLDEKSVELIKKEFAREIDLFNYKY